MSFTTRQKFFFKNRKSQTMSLNKEYLVKHKSFDRIVKLRLIKVTPKGFNLLNEENGKCVLDRHLYPNKKTLKTYDDPMTFFVFKDWIFIEYNEIKHKKIYEITQIRKSS